MAPEWGGPAPIRAIVEQLYARDDIRYLAPESDTDHVLAALLVASSVMRLSGIDELNASSLPGYQLTVREDTVTWRGTKAPIALLNAIADEAIRGDVSPTFRMFATYALLGGGADFAASRESFRLVQEVRRSEVQPPAPPLPRVLADSPSDAQIADWVRATSVDGAYPQERVSYAASAALWEFGGSGVWTDPAASALQDIVVDSVGWARSYQSGSTLAPRLNKRATFSAGEQAMVDRIIQGRIAKILYGGGSGPRGLNRYHGELLTPFAIQAAQRAATKRSRIQAEVLAVLGFAEIEPRLERTSSPVLRSSRWPRIWFTLSLILLAVPIFFGAGWLIGPLASTYPWLAGLLSFVAAAAGAFGLRLCRRLARYEGWLYPKVGSVLLAAVLAACLLAISFVEVANWWFLLILVPAIVVNTAVLYPFVRFGVIPRLKLEEVLKATIRDADYRTIFGQPTEFTTLNNFPGDVSHPTLMRYKTVRWFG